MSSTPCRLRHRVYTLECTDGPIAVSRFTLLKMFDDGHVFKQIVAGGCGFANEDVRYVLDVPRTYGLSRRDVGMLTFAIRTGVVGADVCEIAHAYDAIGGFKLIDAAMARST